MLNDADLADCAPALLARYETVRSAVAAIPVPPVICGFLGLTAPLASSKALLTAPAEALFGRVFLDPVIARHAHTPHCASSCDIRFAPHTHSAACNHSPTPSGEVWEAALSGNVAALEAALVAGFSTEEAEEVRSFKLRGI